MSLRLEDVEKRLAKLERHVAMIWGAEDAEKFGRLIGIEPEEDEERQTNG